jgi:hypothetical protein
VEPDVSGYTFAGCDPTWNFVLMPCSTAVTRPGRMLLAAELPGHGYEVERIVQDDWGRLVQIANPSFPLWIGCGRYEEYADGHLCFIEPSRPYVRRWLKLVSTLQIVERLASALEKIVHDSGQATDLRWWTDTEVASG